LGKEEARKDEDNFLNEIQILLKEKDYMVCRFCNTIAYGNGNCHCGKSFKTDDNWVFCFELFLKELKQQLSSDEEKE
jgi:hypothetical protein